MNALWERGVRRGAGWHLALLLILVVGSVGLTTPAHAEEAIAITRVTGVSNGATIQGRVEIEAQVSGPVDKVEFRLEGPKTASWTENDSPFWFLGHDGDRIKGWDTTTYPNGDYVLRLRATSYGGATVQASRSFRVANGTAAPTPVPPSSEESPLLPVPSQPMNHGPWLQIICPNSHRAEDDPIVFPGRFGASHQHLFAGNRTTRADSTYDSMLRGGTSCEDSGDTAAYWVPTLYDESGTERAPRRIRVYYFRHTDDPESLRPYPPNLRIIAGDARATGPQPRGAIEWLCRAWNDQSDELPLQSTNPPRCSEGQYLALWIRYPDCWDGKNLDSSDHKRHMAYSDGNKRCPSTHPVKLPKLRFSLTYEDKNFRGGNFTLGAPRGHAKAIPWYAMHGDFWNTWQQRVLEEFVNGCLKQRRDVRGIECN